MTWIYIGALFLVSAWQPVAIVATNQPDLMAQTGHTIIYGHSYLAGEAFYDLQPGDSVHTSDGIYTVTSVNIYIAYDTRDAVKGNPTLKTDEGAVLFTDLLDRAEGDLIFTTCFSGEHGHGQTTGRIIVTLNKTGGTLKPPVNAAAQRSE